MTHDERVEKILKEHGLDFHIHKQPLFGADEKGNQLITPYFGLFNGKSGECINTCKAGYTVSQNADIVDMILKGSKGFGNLKVSKAGSINGGRRIFIQLAVEGEAKVGEDKIIRYITIIDSNDGSTSLSVGIGDKVMHCQNQFFKFYDQSDSKFRHTSTLDEKIASLPYRIEEALDKSLKQMELYRKFLSTPLTKKLAQDAIDRVLDIKITDKETPRQLLMMDNMDKALEIELGICGNNVWGLFNAITRYTTHFQSVPKRNNGRDESLISGTGYKKAMAGFEYLSELV